METSTAEKVVVGLGKTGLSCARYLRSTGAMFSVVDSRLNPPSLDVFRAEFPGVELVLGNFDAERLQTASEIILSPGIDPAEPAIAGAIAKGVKVTGDVDIFSRVASAPVVAITGSNGKSTVATLVGEMARCAGMQVGVGGNLDGPAARPALDLLQDETQLYVLELSSFQLETTVQLNAEVAVILNLSEDHMDRYSSMQTYLQAKQRIFRGCAQIVVNRDDPASDPLNTSLDDSCATEKTEQARIWHYGLSAPEDGEFGVVNDGKNEFLAFGQEILLPVKDLRLAGRHNVSNALAALALGHAVGVPVPAMLSALRHFTGLAHRCQWIRRLHDVDFYNDSKGTNPGASVMAIRSIGEMISGAVILIAGGLGKEADFSPLHPVVLQYVRTLVLIGKDAQQLADVLGDATEVVFADSMEEAVTRAWSAALPNDAVLLSPACASLDMFRDFTHRGDVFSAAVEALA